MKGHRGGGFWPILAIFGLRPISGCVCNILAHSGPFSGCAFIFFSSLWLISSFTFIILAHFGPFPASVLLFCPTLHCIFMVLADFSHSPAAFSLFWAILAHFGLHFYYFVPNLAHFGLQF